MFGNRICVFGLERFFSFCTSYLKVLTVTSSLFRNANRNVILLKNGINGGLWWCFLLNCDVRLIGSASVMIINDVVWRGMRGQPFDEVIFTFPKHRRQDNPLNIKTHNWNMKESSEILFGVNSWCPSPVWKWASNCFERWFDRQCAKRDDKTSMRLEREDRNRWDWMQSKPNYEGITSPEREKRKLIFTQHNRTIEDSGRHEAALMGDVQLNPSWD